MGEEKKKKRREKKEKRDVMSPLNAHQFARSCNRKCDTDCLCTKDMQFQRTNQYPQSTITDKNIHLHPKEVVTTGSLYTFVVPGETEW